MLAPCFNEYVKINRSETSERLFGSVRLAEAVVTKRIGRTDRKTLSSLIDSVGLKSSLFRIITAWIVTNGHHRWRCYSHSVTGLASTK